MEIESDSAIPFLDVLVIRKGAALATQDRFNEISNLRLDLQLSGYLQGFIDSVTNSEGSSCPNKEEKPLGSVYIP
jgi:hypothetical protein